MAFHRDCTLHFLTRNVFITSASNLVQIYTELGIWLTCLLIDVTLGMLTESCVYEMAPTSTFLTSGLVRQAEPLAIRWPFDILFCSAASGPASRLSFVDNTFHIPFVRRHTLLLYISLAK